eukprot:TRINITY_DN3018_c0_g1_i4.p1 TRINITY_DN3018_c0_g1~~TRINITY_DN3018_c0_g1_i4.p1  ORF type:complete len:152 (+),score=51.74 TRINITY_DN3018_c0_g1_i4:61-516(+)
MAAVEEVELPRSFKLLDEYDAAIGKAGKSFLKGQHANFIQYGLVSDDDMDLALWRATVIGPQGKQLGEFIYTLEIYVGPNYPQVPPRAKFISPKIAMDAVGADGTVDPTRLEPRFVWRQNMNIADLLMAIRENMNNDRVCQQSAHLGDTSY